MTVTRFPHGISVRGVEVLGGSSGEVIAPKANVLFVDSNHALAADGVYNGTSEHPYATLNHAFSQCDENNGDRIFVANNHAETVTGAGGITAAKAGVTVEGLGFYNQRPRFLMDGAATVTLTVTAADVVFKNLVFAAGHADIAACFAITAKGCGLFNLEFVDNTTAENWLTPIKATSTTDNNADGLTVVGCRWFSPDVAGLEFIEYNADILRLICQHNYVVHEGTASPLILGATGKDLHYHDIRWNFLSHKMTANELLLNIDTSDNPGIIAHNRVRHADVTTSHDLGIDGLGSALFDNLSVSVDNLSGFVLPAVDVNS